MTTTEFDLAKRIAGATGAQVVIGVRPNGTWFANCNRHEWDAGTPGKALQALKEDLEQGLREQVLACDAQHRNAQTALTNLIG